MRHIAALGAVLALASIANATPITIYYNDCSSLDGVTTRQGDWPTGDLGPPYLANGGIMADVPATETGYFMFDINMDPNNPEYPNEGISIVNEGQGDFKISLRWDADPSDPNWCPDPNASEWICFWYRAYSSKPDPNDPNGWVYAGRRNFSFFIPACQGWQAYDRDINDWDESDPGFDPEHVYALRLDYVVWTSDYHPCSIGFDELEFYTPECPRDLTGDDDVDIGDLAELLGAYGCDETPVILFDSGGFESYVDGALPGQFEWYSVTGDWDPNDAFTFTDPVVGDDPTGGGNGKVVIIDAPDGSSWDGYTGAGHDTWNDPNDPNAPTVGAIYIEWDQYRPDIGDNFFYEDQNGGWWAVQWDVDGCSAEGYGNGAVSLTTGVWQHIRYELDFDTGTATVDVDGTTGSAPFVDDVFDGFYFYLVGTDIEGDGPIYLDNFVIKQSMTPHCPIDWFDDGTTSLNDLAHLLGQYGCGVP